MHTTLPINVILDLMRREHPDGQPSLRLHAPEPSDPLHDPRDHEWPPRKIDEEERPERGVAIIAFTI